MSAESELARELTADEQGLLYDLVIARQMLAQAKENEEKAKSQLAASLDEHTHGLIDDIHVVTVTRSRPERFDINSFRNDHELLARAYMRPVEAEVVRVLVRPAAKQAAIRAGALSA